MLLKLRERELEEARAVLAAARKRVAELEEARTEAAAQADRAERALSAFQIEVDNRLDTTFSAAERQWLADEEAAVAARVERANAVFKTASSTLDLAQKSIEEAQAQCASCLRLLRAARRHRELWTARRAAALDSVEEMDMEARVFSLTDEPTS